jgi:hypothetical protein
MLRPARRRRNSMDGATARSVESAVPPESALAKEGASS